MYTLVYPKQYYINEFKVNSNVVLYIVKSMYQAEKIKDELVKLKKNPPVSSLLVKDKPAFLRLTNVAILKLVNFIKSLLDIDETTSTTIPALQSFADLQRELGISDLSTPPNTVFPFWYDYYWKFLHYATILIYIDQRAGGTSALEQFKYIFVTFFMYIPCGECQENFKKKPRIEIAKTFDTDIIYKMFEFHNYVNSLPRISNKAPSSITFDEFCKIYSINGENIS